MRIIKARDYEDVSRKAANIIFSVMTEKPDCVLGLATGSSPVGIYKELVRHYQEGDLDFSRVTTVNLDEYRGLDREDPQSYAYYMRENLFSHVNIRTEKTFLPDGTEEDSQKACEGYDQILSQAGQQDIQLLGIGHDGHIGFNEPADHFPKGTHCVDLAESTIEANARFFESRDQVPTQADSYGSKWKRKGSDPETGIPGTCYSSGSRFYPSASSSGDPGGRRGSPVRDGKLLTMGLSALRYF